MIDKPKIRIANVQDLPAVVAIYNQAIQSKTATGDMDEFTVAERLDWFNKFDPNHFPIYVATIRENIVGYATLSPYRPGRKAMQKIAEISFYLDYTYHGKGIGSALVSHAIADCTRIGKETLLAILLDINTSSIGLLRKFGFEEWGHLPRVIDLEGLRCGQYIFGYSIK